MMVCVERCASPSDEEKEGPEFFLRVNGNTVDTAYIGSLYADPGAMMLDRSFELVRGSDDNIQAEGSVRTDAEGTFTISYSGFAPPGTELAPVTRTVHVVPNTVAYLNGVYDATCICTMDDSTHSHVASAESYSSVVSPSAQKGCFELSMVDIGPGYMTTRACVTGNSIDLSYYDPDIDFRSTCKGVVAPSHDAFTVTSIAYQYSPLVTSTCVSQFKRRLTVNASKIR